MCKQVGSPNPEWKVTQHFPKRGVGAGPVLDALITVAKVNK